MISRMVGFQYIFDEVTSYIAHLNICDLILMMIVNNSNIT